MEVNPGPELSLSGDALRNRHEGAPICEPVPSALSGFEYHDDIHRLAGQS